jgi:hypothetical protein
VPAGAGLFRVQGAPLRVCVSGAAAASLRAAAATGLLADIPAGLLALPLSDVQVRRSARRLRGPALQPTASGPGSPVGLGAVGRRHCPAAPSRCPAGPWHRQPARPATCRAGGPQPAT